eukprot:160871_1
MFHIQLLILLFHLNLLIHSHYPSDIGDSDAIIHCSDERDTIDNDHSVSDQVNYDDWTPFPIDLQHLFDPKFHRKIATLLNAATVQFIWTHIAPVDIQKIPVTIPLYLLEAIHFDPMITVNPRINITIRFTVSYPQFTFISIAFAYNPCDVP